MKIEADSRVAKWDGDAPSHDDIPDAGTPKRDLPTLVSSVLPRGGRAVLAVSGGLDSMALLDVAAAVRQRRRSALTVATFDHASGAHSTRAASLVADTALTYGLPAVVGRAQGTDRTEAAWRAARWEFLRSVSQRVGGAVITAHTRDDQIETVLMRALRGAGARGLAGLRASSRVRRPFVDVRRDELQVYARARTLRWVEDPSNRSALYLRNRLRHDLLPALERVRPALGEELLELGVRAAAWRHELAALIDASIRYAVRREADGKTLDIPAAELTGLTTDILGIVWPELAARAGVVLDRRGTMRAAEFTLSSKVGGRIQLSGGWQLIRSREWFELRRLETTSGGEDNGIALVAPLTWRAWRFSTTGEAADGDPWQLSVSAKLALRVRPWRPGDRLTVRHGDRLVMRKVKYFLSDARISGHIRARWPVVLAGDEIVWIPGVRRSDAATARSGGPVVTYVCDYLDRRS
jgi:tRNA(Ile)-lysidine synthase